MKKIIYSFFAGLILLSSQSIYSQNEESSIVISEDNLALLINKLRAYKKTKREAQFSNTIYYNEISPDSVKTSDSKLDYLNKKIGKLEKELIQVKGTKNKSYTTNDDDTSNSLRNINKELEEIRNSIQLLSKKSNIERTIVVQPNSNKKANVKSTEKREAINRDNVLPIVTSVKTDNAEYKKLQAKMDSLQAEFSANKTLNKTDNTNQLKEQANYDDAFSTLQNQLEVLSLKLEERNNALTAYELLNAKFKGYKQSIFFGNNSVALNPEAQIKIDEIYALLNENENLDVIVKGFASNKGNPKYNESLSMQRTEAIKKALMLKGVHPTRVLTQYHGIDYNANDAASARRVENSFLVRK